MTPLLSFKILICPLKAQVIILGEAGVAIGMCFEDLKQVYRESQYALRTNDLICGLLMSQNEHD